MADANPEAKAWMVKAWRDLETARRAATGQPPFYDVAVYHCQQAAEKAVKAFLVHHGKPYEKTHDIEVLKCWLTLPARLTPTSGSWPTPPMR